MNGFFMVGSPVIGYGHGQHVGWAPTTGGPDTADVYEMKIKMEGPLLQYEYDGEWRTPEIAMEKINVKDSAPVTRAVVYTHLGPLVSDPNLEQGIAYAGATPYIESTGFFEQSLRMCLAKDADEFYEALKLNELMEQNLMYADTSGNIGYIRVGRAPKRPAGYDWNAPVPGHTSKTAWNGLHEFGDLVQLKNPEKGYMQNCNISPENMMVDSPMTPDKYVDYLYNVTWDFNNPRGKRITKLLEENSHVSKEAAMAYAQDIYDILAEPWQKVLSQAVKDNGEAMLLEPELRDAVDKILAWDGRYTTDSLGTVLFKYWRIKCSKNNVDVLAIRDGDDLSAEQHLVLIQLLKESMEDMKSRFGKWNVTWGEVHKVGRSGQYFPSPGADFNGNADGPNFTETLFDVKSHTDKNNPKQEIAYSGSMAMMLMFFSADGIESFTCTPWGQNADPDSPHHVDQARDLYSKGVMKPTLWTMDELKNKIQSDIILELK